MQNNFQPLNIQISDLNALSRLGGGGFADVYRFQDP
jgi:hypothetical protein